jgi:hypothetical protein
MCLDGYSASFYDKDNVIMCRKHVPPGIISVTISFKYQYLEMLASSKKYQISRGRYTIQKIKKLKSK